MDQHGPKSFKTVPNGPNCPEWFIPCPKWTKMVKKLSKMVLYGLIWSNVVEFLSTKSFKLVRHDQVSWSSLNTIGALGVCTWYFTVVYNAIMYITYSFSVHSWSWAGFNTVFLLCQFHKACENTALNDTTRHYSAVVVYVSEKLDRVAPLVTNPPQSYSTTRQNQPICDPQFKLP